MSEDKERAVMRLRELEKEQRDAVAHLREQLDAGGPLRGTAARIVARYSRTVSQPAAILIP